MFAGSLEDSVNGSRSLALTTSTDPTPADVTSSQYAEAAGSSSPIAAQETSIVVLATQAIDLSSQITDTVSSTSGTSHDNSQLEESNLHPKPSETVQIIPNSSSISSLSSDNDIPSDSELAASQSNEQSPSQYGLQESSWHPQPSETVQAIPTSSSINSFSSDNDLVSGTELAASQSNEQSPSPV